MAANARLQLGNLPRKQARLCLAVEKFCCKDLHIQHGASILLAVSGGADSIAMAAICSIISPRQGWRLSAVHVNHGLRAEAGMDADFSRSFCASLGIDCTVFNLDITRLARLHNCGLEEAGRLGRYAVFEEERTRCQCDFIAVAHHGGDLCEDILMRLTRGTGWPALGGMKAKDERRRLIRPLFQKKPEELRDFLRSINFAWREDASNSSAAFKRNRIRNTVLPLLHAENSRLATVMGSLHKMAQIDELYWEDVLKKALEKYPWEISEAGSHTFIRLGGELLSFLEAAARLRLYHKALRQLAETCKNSTQARAETLFKLDEAWLGRRGKLIFQFPGNVHAQIQGKEIIFSA